MNEQEAINELGQLLGEDPESEHIKADGILVEFLRSNGYQALAEAYEQTDNRVRFWYA